MQVSISVDEIIDQMKLQISELSHQLMLAGMTNVKLSERLEKYESMETEQNPEPMLPKPVRRLSAVPETLAGIESKALHDSV